MKTKLKATHPGSSQRQAQQAGTLLEVLMASCVLAVMAAAIMNSINYGLFVMRNARENQRATQIMLEKSEAVRLYNWEQINASNFIPATFTAVFDPQSATAPGITYYGTMAITNCPFNASYATNVRLFTITLNWTNFHKIPHSRILSTLVAKDGIQNYVY